MLSNHCHIPLICNKSNIHLFHNHFTSRNIQQPLFSGLHVGFFHQYIVKFLIYACKTICTPSLTSTTKCLLSLNILISLFVSSSVDVSNNQSTLLIHCENQHWNRMWHTSGPRCPIDTKHIIHIRNLQTTLYSESLSQHLDDIQSYLQLHQW